jgi:hypothetical protein
VRLAVARGAVGEEHRAELADDGIEAAIAERQIEGVGLLPGDAPVGWLPGRRIVEHRLIEVGHH